MQKSRLTNLELYSEDGSYYLKAEYEVEDEHRLEKYTFPKLYLPIGGIVLRFMIDVDFNQKSSLVF